MSCSSFRCFIFCSGNSKANFSCTDFLFGLCWKVVAASFLGCCRCALTLPPGGESFPLGKNTVRYKNSHGQRQTDEHRQWNNLYMQKEVTNLLSVVHVCSVLHIHCPNDHHLVHHPQITGPPLFQSTSSCQFISPVCPWLHFHLRWIHGRWQLKNSSSDVQQQHSGLHFQLQPCFRFVSFTYPLLAWYEPRLRNQAVVWLSVNIMFVWRFHMIWFDETNYCKMCWFCSEASSHTLYREYSHTSAE